MHTSVVPRFVRRLTRIASASLVAILILGTLPESASAVSSWNPTLLVNTESFQTIDSGDGTTDIELRFGSTTTTIKFLFALQKFQLSKSLSVIGSISGSSLTIDGVASFSGAVTAKKTINATGNITTQGAFSGASLRVSGPAEVFGALTASGALRTDSNITINDDADTNDAVLTFGNTSGNQTLKFLNTSQRFQFSKSISVVGVISGSLLAIDGNATISGSLLVKNNIAAKGTVSGSLISGFGLGSCNGTTQKLVYNSTSGKFECATDNNSGSFSTGNVLSIGDARYVNQSGDTMTGALAVRANISGSTLRVSGNADVQGALTASGAFRTDSNITINDDADTNDAVLTFGNNSGNQTLKFLNTSQKFQFTRGLSVVGILSGSQLAIDGSATISGALLVKNSIKTKGSISGSTLTVDGNITLHGVTYAAPSAQGGANTFLKNDGAGNLTWTATSVGNASGSIMSMHPDYPGAVYFASGSSMVGQLTMSGGTSGLENSYAWTTSRSTMQDYWVSVRGRVPDNFSSWDPVKPAEFRYKTGTTGWQNNHLTLKVRDTAGTLFTLTGGLVSTAYTTVNIDPNETTAFSSGVWTPKGYFTVYVKVAATSAANAAAYASFINMNFETTIP